MTASVRFEVLGQPVPQGSKSAIRVGARTVVVEQNRARLRPWRAQVSEAAERAMNGSAPLLGPLQLDLQLFLRRPKTHYRADGDLKASAPEYVTTRPDADKVVRAVADAMSAIVYRDDSQLAELYVVKLYDERPRIVVEVKPVSARIDA